MGPSRDSAIPLKQRVGNQDKYTAVEDQLDLQCYGEFRLQGNQVGFRYNKSWRGPARIVMDWRLTPAHSTMSEADAEKLIPKWVLMLQGVTSGEDFTFDYSCFATDDVVNFLPKIAFRRGYDFRIVVQFSTAAGAMRKFNLERTTRNAQHQIDGAAKRKDVNVAEDTLIETKEAQRLIQRGDKFLLVSAGIFGMVQIQVTL